MAMDGTSENIRDDVDPSVSVAEHTTGKTIGTAAIFATIGGILKRSIGISTMHHKR